MCTIPSSHPTSEKGGFPFEAAKGCCLLLYNIVKWKGLTQKAGLLLVSILTKFNILCGPKVSVLLFSDTWEREGGAGDRQTDGYRNI